MAGHPHTNATTPQEPCRTRARERKTATPPQYVAAFRTYAWDDDIAELARRFFASVPSARQVVLVDESRGPINIPGYETVAHTAETVCPGLPNHPRDRSLWFNVDYGVYALQRELPDFDHYLLSESDLAVNLPLEPMIRFAITKGIDLIAHGVEPSYPGWGWHPNGLFLSPNPWKSLLFFMVLSRRAITCLLAARQQLALRFQAGEIDFWPFCETFVPTVLKSARGMRFADVSRFATTDNLNYRPRLSLHDPRANRPGSLAHSVLGGKRFIATLLREYPVGDFFRAGSELREALLGEAPFEDIVQPLIRALAKERDLAGIALVLEEAAARGWPVDPAPDLAFCKPAVSSSVSRWSLYQNPELDGCGANGNLLPYEYGFHTAKEFNPWWMVDLLDECIVEEVAIVNRLSRAQHFRTFCIETSCDGDGWTIRFQQTDPADVSSDPESPWRLRFADPFPARYLRIVLLGVDVLHLRRVQIFGRVQTAHPRTSSSAKSWAQPVWPVLGPTTDLAFCRPAVSSSVSAWSWYEDPERDARGANGDSLPNDYAFHTRREFNPWWMVDLLGEHIVEEVAIVNRHRGADRFRTFYIETSCDGQTWTTRYRQDDPGDVSSDPASPWRMQCRDPFPARYLRIVLLGADALHLRRVQVFGRARTTPPWTSPLAQPSESGSGWPLGPTTDLAFCKPAMTSSVSAWSRSQDPEIDARGANRESLSYDYGFHTGKECSPWWMVDLLGEHIVDEVAIVNRHSGSERFRTFSIGTSCDGKTWTTRFRQDEPIDVSSDPDSPWRLGFTDPFPARYLRIVLSGMNVLHLRRVQVFGRVQPAHHIRA